MTDKNEVRRARRNRRREAERGFTYGAWTVALGEDAEGFSCWRIDNGLVELEMHGDLEDQDLAQRVGQALLRGWDPLTG